MKILFFALLFLSTHAFSLTPTLKNLTNSCANKYCMTIRGVDFDADASVMVREDSTGSVSTEFAGFDIYTRTFSNAEDMLFFPIQSLSLQNMWENNGLCFSINNKGVLSNEQCHIKTQFPIQPQFMGQSIESYPGQDIEHTSWIVKGDASLLVGGDLLKITGNSWKQINYNYTITPNTILKFDFKSNQQQSEINGVGFRFSNGTIQHFQVYGTQNWKNQDYHNYSGTDFISYEIPVGEYFTGNVSKMFFTADEDNHVGQRIAYKNPRLLEKKAIINANSTNKVDGKYILIYDNQTVQQKATTSNKSLAQTVVDISVELADPLANEGQFQALFDTAFYGSVINNPSSEQLNAILTDDRVTKVYQDTYIEALGTQNNAPWGLDRIDQTIGLDSLYHYGNDASSVNVYVMDTGIYSEHNEFIERNVDEVDFSEEGAPQYCVAAFQSSVLDHPLLS